MNIRKLLWPLDPQRFAPKRALPPTEESAYSYSLLYGLLSFNSYNPDDLIGRKGYDIYRKMSVDEQIKAVLKFRRSATTGRKWFFDFLDADKEILDDAEMAHRVALFECVVAKIPGSFRTSLKSVMRSLEYGFSVTEKTFAPIEFDGKTWWGIKALKPKPIDAFVFERDEYGTLVSMYQDIGIPHKAPSLDRSRFIHHVTNADIDEYYGQSELREAYRAWWSKDVIIRLRNIFLERMAGGFAKMQPKQGRTLIPGSSDEAKAKDILTSLTGKSSVLLPEWLDLSIEGPKSTDAFDVAESRCDRSIAKALLMPNLLGLTEQGNTGSYSQSQTQLEAFLWLLDAEAADLEETINEQLFSQLGEYNFEDGIYPRFRFQPLSQVMIQTIATTWSQLVGSGSVEATDTDEAYLRNILGFPVKGDPIKRAPSIVEPAVTAPLVDDGESAHETENAEIEEQGNELQDDETVVGSSALSIDYARFRRAERRVDFASIDRGATVVQWVGEQELSAALATLYAWFRETASNISNPSEAARLVAPASTVSAMRKAAKKALRDGWALGQENAKREAEKSGATGLNKQKLARFAALGELASAYFDARAFDVAGNLTDDALKMMKQAISNGIKYGWTNDEVIADFYRQAAAKSMVPAEDADLLEQLLGEALEATNLQARLETIIRTSTFEAINESRFQFFTAPELDGFVTALSYSSILDGRTTEICRELGGDSTGTPFVALATSADWDKYRPPNHYNCRSLLIAVTENDDEPTTSLPPRVASGEVQPAPGFGG